MKVRTLTAVAVAGAFALPFTMHASADNDRSVVAQSGASSMGGDDARRLRPSGTELR